MSRLGRKTIDIPDKVKVAVNGRQVSVEGPSGKVSWIHRPEVTVKIEGGKTISVARIGETKLIRALHGTTRSIVAGMLVGASKGYEKGLEINGVGYNAKLNGTSLVLTIGFSHPVEFKVPAGITATVPSPTTITIKGADKRLVGEFAAEVRRARKAEPYNLKGIKYKDEVVRRKAGKTFVTGSG